MRPRWVYAGASDDLAVALHGLGSFSDVMLYEVNGGLFVTWSRVRREFRQGVLAYLIRSLRPLVRNRHTPADDVKPVKVAVPSDIGASGRATKSSPAAAAAKTADGPPPPPALEST